MKKVIFSFLTLLSLASCTEQQRAKNYGGTTTVDLPIGQKLVNVTWKGNADIWYLTRPMTTSDSAVTYTFYQEKGTILSITGNGKIIIKEHK